MSPQFLPPGTPTPLLFLHHRLPRVRHLRVSYRFSSSTGNRFPPQQPAPSTLPASPLLLRRRGDTRLRRRAYCLRWWGGWFTHAWLVHAGRGEVLGRGFRDVREHVVVSVSVVGPVAGTRTGVGHVDIRCVGVAEGCVGVHGRVDGCCVGFPRAELSLVDLGHAFGCNVVVLSDDGSLLLWISAHGEAPINIAVQCAAEGFAGAL